MRVPVYFRQCSSAEDAGQFMREFCETHGISQDNMVFWEEHLLAGLVGDSIRICPSDRFHVKICFYDCAEKDYELGIWSSAIHVFADVKASVLNLSFEEAAGEYFKNRGIDDAETVLNDRVQCQGWDVPKFFVEHGVETFECMFDCENYMRKVIASERIFKCLDADKMIFQKGETL